MLVSEVMLQQTSVARVLPRWARFVERWPTPQSCAAAPLEDVLRAWDGLGYPRRARALRETAALVSRDGWPADERGLRMLPGVGEYTARALLCFALGGGERLPRDVNIARVAARAGLGVEAHQATGRELDGALATATPPGMSSRDCAFALFDLGAAICLARRPRCGDCPVAAGCASRARLSSGPPARPRRSAAPYPGSLRQLRGAVLRALLDSEPPRDVDELRRRVRRVPAAARPGAVEDALAGLCSDGLATPLPAGGG